MRHSFCSRYRGAPVAHEVYCCCHLIGGSNEHTVVAAVYRQIPLISEFLMPNNQKFKGDHKMKTTYLVYKQVNGVLQLTAATQEEWDAILKENRQMPEGITSGDYLHLRR